MRNRWNAEITDKSTFCKESKETVIHVLWECKYVENFWKKLAQWLSYVCKIEDPKFTLYNIIINKTNGKYKEFIDSVILIAKQYIYASKCKEESPTVIKYLTVSHNNYCTERAVATQDDKL